MMTLDEFCRAGWRDHADDAQAVMDRLPQGFGLIAGASDLPKLGALVLHVAGEHLGRWPEGIALMERLRSHASFDAASPDGKSVLRSLAVLHACAGDSDEAERLTQASLGGGFPEASDRARIQALIASTLTGQHRIAEASRALQSALRLAAYGPDAKDPASRALAVTGNNLASELEMRSSLSGEETALMLLAAETGRTYWGIAGGWMETERAEYRLAKSCLKAGEIARAARHAAECVRIVLENGTDPGEIFFAHEATARVRLAAGEREEAAAAARDAEAALPAIADEGFRAYCAGEMETLRRDVSA